MGMTADCGGGPGWVVPEEVTACNRDFRSQVAGLLERAMRQPNGACRMQFQPPFGWQPDQILEHLKGPRDITKLHDLVQTFGIFGYRLRLEIEPME